MSNTPRSRRRLREQVAAAPALGLVALLFLTGAATLRLETPQDGPPGEASARLEETRLAMSKWIETQQILTRERNEWQHGKEVLLGRLELVKQDVAPLEQKIQEAEGAIAETAKKRAELAAEGAELEATLAQLLASVSVMEQGIRTLYRALPEPVQEKLQPLFERIPEDPATTKVGAPERFQNALGILNELNRLNNEVTVTYEVRKLSDGKPAEVQVLYAGLAQAWYVNHSGEAGIGVPSATGWSWRPEPEIADEVLTALEVLQGKHTPAFIPLPVRIQ